ncbi:hemerythrin domain-containing protein [Streptomyces erythrochromogenes]|uniref:hemerythrin domain-containing protein n=1 Tax=Streptomyces erythrochromogenes TaxID=285574 RepID=UPI0037FC27C5
MSPSTIPERPHTHEMVVVHRVFRRESALLPRLVRAVPDGAKARAEQVATHLAEYLAGLHHHHTVEDETIWPLLHERAADGELLARMEEQHAEIDRVSETVTDRALQWRRTAGSTAAEHLAVALDEHRAALLGHLDDEERLILPLVADYLTVAEWDAVGRRGMEGVPRDRLMIALGALLEEATPQEQAYFLARAPFIGRLLWKAVGRRQYAASCRALRGPLSAFDGGAGR